MIAETYYWNYTTQVNMSTLCKCIVNCQRVNTVIIFLLKSVGTCQKKTKSYTYSIEKITRNQL